VPGPFADDQLAAFVAQPSPPFAQLDDLHATMEMRLLVDSMECVV
jgi:hypothetical protein